MTRQIHNPSDKGKQQPDRGLGLSIWLILTVVLSFITGVATMSLMNQPAGPTREWLVSLFLIFTAAKAVAALGIWYWNTWGLYIYAISVLGSMGITLVLTKVMIWGVFYEAIPLLITGWLLRNKLDYFK